MKGCSRDFIIAALGGRWGGKEGEREKKAEEREMRERDTHTLHSEPYRLQISN